MDQKCTPDIIYLIAECIVNITKNEAFTGRDIQNSVTFNSNLQFYFNKPDPTIKTVANEIDKIISQPLKTLTFAGLLTEIRIGRSYQYSINDKDSLEVLAVNERNCFKFLCALNEKTLQDSGLDRTLATYENSEYSKSDYLAFRDEMYLFYKKHTKLGTRGSVDDGRTEFRRILPKILNPISVERGMPGVAGGSITKDDFIYQELMYNRPNWRDLDKDKNLSRAENLAKAANTSLKTSLYLANENTKAKKLVLRHHNGKSEVSDSLATGNATQAHHIFPVSRYSDLQAVPENIIALTASQHYQKAHPNNNTALIDPEYQRTCLLSKLSSVRTSIINEDLFYSKESFIWLLQEALGVKVLTPDSSFDQIRLFLGNHQF